MNWTTRRVFDALSFLCGFLVVFGVRFVGWWTLAITIPIAFVFVVIRGEWGSIRAQLAAARRANHLHDHLHDHRP